LLNARRRRVDPLSEALRQGQTRLGLLRPRCSWVQISLKSSVKRPELSDAYPRVGISWAIQHFNRVLVHVPNV
jgi:hypothetical protein